MSQPIQPNQIFTDDSSTNKVEEELKIQEAEIDQDEDSQNAENQGDKINNQMEFESVSINQEAEEEEDDSSNDQELMPRALPIQSSSDIDSGHEDYEGLQYLLNVRREANKTSNIMVAKNVNIIQSETDQKYIPQSILKGEFQETSKLNSWEQDQLNQFKNFKKHLEYIDEQVQKGIKPSDIISNYYYGLEDDKYIKSKKCFLENFTNEDLTKVVIPSTQTLQKITYIRLEKILEYIDHVINDKLEFAEQIQHENKENVMQLYKEKQVFLNYYQYLWIYGLMGRLDNPILADISCILNRILKMAVFQQKNSEQNQEDYQMIQAMTQIIIVIIREYYGQKYIAI
ncbi:hypothetical protein ABPG72_015417 [Tetrahymena utriculariae]